MTEKNTETPQIRKPYCRSSLNSPSFSKLDTDITTDVLIVGGGITGITQLNKVLKLH